MQSHCTHTHTRTHAHTHIDKMVCRTILHMYRHCIYWILSARSVPST